MTLALAELMQWEPGACTGTEKRASLETEMTRRSIVVGWCRLRSPKRRRLAAVVCGRGGRPTEPIATEAHEETERGLAERAATTSA